MPEDYYTNLARKLYGYSTPQLRQMVKMRAYRHLYGLEKSADMKKVLDKPVVLGYNNRVR